MDAANFKESLMDNVPPPMLSPAMEALCWDAKDEWTRAHDLVNELDSIDAMAVHAYLHRRQGEQRNAEYWYQRSGDDYRKPELDAEWWALVDGLSAQS